MEMLTIVSLARGADGRHFLQAQSGRTECWLEGWIILPERLRAEFEACGGFCELTVEDGALAAIVPDPDNPTPWYRRLEEAEQEIEQLKQELAGTDYRVLKCWEADQTGQPDPYDRTELVSRRQALRDAINAAQQTRAELEEKIIAYCEGKRSPQGGGAA